MFVQVISLKAPINRIKQLRQLVADEYLPAIRQRPGFLSASLLEQCDDPDTAMLVVYWSNQEAVEDLHKTGVLAGSTQSIAARMPGLRIQRTSYIARVTIDNKVNEATV
mgnify:CR=1 FL=1